jgi:c(7)-type cytochrome triheme protein
MKRFFVLIFAIMITFVMAASAIAVPSGKTVEFDGKGGGKVVFDGKIHAAKAKCADCHTKLFPYKKGTVVLSMKDMNEGKNCGACHDGTKAFSTKDAASCAKCHKK